MPAVADEMPKQGFLDMFTRRKLIHSVGGIAPCKVRHKHTALASGAGPRGAALTMRPCVQFVAASGSPYTGLFRGVSRCPERLSPGPGTAKAPAPR